MKLKSNYDTLKTLNNFVMSSSKPCPLAKRESPSSRTTYPTSRKDIRSIFSMNNNETQKKRKEIMKKQKKKKEKEKIAEKCSSVFYCIFGVVSRISYNSVWNPTKKEKVRDLRGTSKSR